MDHYKLLIGGKLVDGASTMDVLNPATEEVLVKAPRADKAQLEQAIAAAKAAFPAWSKMKTKDRGALIMKAADALDAQRSEFVRLLVEEQGKPVPQADFEIMFSAVMLRYFASLELNDKIIQEDAKTKIVQQHTPLGVVAAITPWNFPMILLMMKVGPGLLAGNTMVVKPAPTTPLTTLKFGEICSKIFPPGVINVITDQNDLGDALTSHKDVAKVAFTGSTATGKKVMQSVSSTLKRLTLELGGNDAGIVLDDADPKKMAEQIFMGAMVNSGQVCLAIKRLYVHSSIYDEMCNELAKIASHTVVDDGLKQGTQMGPLQNKAQYEKVKAYLEDAKKNGKIIAGGDALERKGYFIAPTIVRDITDDARVVREEQFGPILPVLKYDDLDDAISRANDTDYGLGGTIWTSNPERGLEVAKRIDSGTVWVNKHLELPPDVPFGGAKQSGIGVEQGIEGLEAFTQTKIINMAK